MPKHKELKVSKEIGAVLKTLRTAKGETSKDAARVVDVTFQQYQKYEHGINRISAGKLNVFAEHYNVPIANFFDKRNACKPLDSRTMRLMKNYKKADEVGKKIIRDVARIAS